MTRIFSNALTLARQRPQNSGAANPRFSGNWLVNTNNLLSAIQKTRTHEMLFIDAMGFGVCRSALDLMRPYIFKKTNLQKPEPNWIAARERMVGEAGSILTDNIAGGIFALAIAGVANKWMGQRNIANQFMSNETLSLFKDIAKNTPNANAFIESLAQQIPQANETVKAKLQDCVQQAVSNPMKNAAQKAQAQRLFEDTATEIARIVKSGQKTPQQSYDVLLGKNTFALTDLVEDAAKFVKSMDKKGWAQAPKLIETTQWVNKVRLPISMALVMGLTFSVPYLNRAWTRAKNKLEGYPAEYGLRDVQKTDEKALSKKPFLDRMFPYLSQSVKKGNLWPIAGMLPFLYTGLGMVDTGALSNMSIKKAFTLKNFWSRLQFGKGFPYTMQQQMASFFALLIFSRLSTTRDSIEFRERFIESVLGWGSWILLTPLLKNLFAKKMGIHKTVDGLTLVKTPMEIQRLRLNTHTAEGAKALLQKQGLKGLLGKSVLLNGACMGITVLLLGLLEPLIAIKWSERQAKKFEGKEKSGITASTIPSQLPQPVLPTVGAPLQTGNYTARPENYFVSPGYFSPYPALAYNASNNKVPGNAVYQQ